MIVPDLDNLSADDRLRHLAAELHDLGPEALFYFIRELDDGADLRRTLETYARLTAQIVRRHKQEIGTIVTIDGGKP